MGQTNGTQITADARFPNETAIRELQKRLGATGWNTLLSRIHQRSGPSRILLSELVTPHFQPPRRTQGKHTKGDSTIESICQTKIVMQPIHVVLVGGEKIVADGNRRVLGSTMAQLIDIEAYTYKGINPAHVFSLLNVSSISPLEWAWAQYHDKEIIPPVKIMNKIIELRDIIGEKLYKQYVIDEGRGSPGSLLAETKRVFDGILPQLGAPSVSDQKHWKKKIIVWLIEYEQQDKVGQVLDRPRFGDKQRDHLIACIENGESCV